MQKSLVSINRDFSAFSLFPKKKEPEKEIWGEMFFVSNRDFHRAPNIIVIDADSFFFIFEYLEDWLCRRFAVWVIGTRVERKKGRVVG